MIATTQTIGEFLQRYGWTYEAAGEQLLVTGFQGRTGTFRLFVQAADPWVLLAIVPFIPRPQAECRERMARFLVRLNYELNAAKIGVDGDGDVALCVELRAEDLRFEDLATALDALAYYSGEYYVPLLNLATDPNYVPDAKLWEAWA